MESPKFKEFTKKDLKNINNCFTNYLFYETLKNGSRRYTCTHCGKVFIQPEYKRTMTQLNYELHTTSHNDALKCPYCEANAIAKNIGKSKKCKNLYEEQRIVIIQRISENHVQARAVIASKDYEHNYTPSVSLYEESRYDFKPGAATQYKFYWYDKKFYSVKTAGEPFTPKQNWGWYWVIPDNSYSVFGLENLGSTFLRYNMLDKYSNYYAQIHNRNSVVELHFMKYLSRFTEYPQMEMLQKLGYYDIVYDLVEKNKKSFPYVNWRAEKLNDFFKMSKQDFKEFRNFGGNLEFLKVRKRIYKLTGDNSMKTAEKYFKWVGNEYNYEQMYDTIANSDLPLREGIEYLIKQHKKGGRDIYDTCHEYRDYYQMADELNYDLKNPVVKFPKNLKYAHDMTMETHRAFLEEKKAKELKELQKKATAQLKNNDKQYSFTDGKYIIIVPHTVEEIVREGKLQKHCVGGYAGRHMEGKLTICFLRTTRKPDNPLYTIEMHDKALTQVQGFNNRTPLTPDAKEFFDSWLDWVKSGSKRNKNGEPILKKKLAAKTA